MEMMPPRVRGRSPPRARSDMSDARAGTARCQRPRLPHYDADSFLDARHAMHALYIYD